MQTIHTMTKFGDKISKAIGGTTLAKHRLSADLGLGKNTVGRWCSGESVPSADGVFRIARYLGLTADYLLDDELDEPPAPDVTPDERAVLQIVRELGVAEARRRLLLAMPEITSPYEIDPAVEHARRAKAAIGPNLSAKKSG